MRRLSILLMAAISALVVAAAPAAASSETAAFVVMIDDPICTAAANGLSAQGSIQAAFTSNGTWQMTCRGELPPGTAPDAAVVVRSTTADPIEVCWTPYGETYDWQVVFSANGNALITCHGDVNNLYGDS